MKAFLIIISILLLVVSTGFARKSVPLEEVGQPGQITVMGDNLYVAERAEILVYSLKDYRLVKKIGGPGEGPKQFKITPFGPGLQLYPWKDGFLVNSSGKISFYDKSGKYLEEKKVKPFSIYIPLKNNYVCNSSYPVSKKQMVLSIEVVDASFKKIKELFQTDKTVGSGLYSNLLFDKIYLPYNAFVYPVYEGNAYIAYEKEKEKGVFIEVFDKMGKKRRGFRLDLSAETVSEEYKKEMLTWFERYSPLKSFWERIRGNIKFKTHFPILKHFIVDNDTIYVITHNKKDDRNLCLLLDLKGKERKRIYLPIPKEAPFAPVRYTITNSIFYFLASNEDTETWELNRFPIK